MLIKLCICLACSREGSEDSFCKPGGQKACCLFPQCTVWKVNWKKLVKSLCERLPWYKSKTLHGADHKLKTIAKTKHCRRESICWVQRAKQQQSISQTAREYCICKFCITGRYGEETGMQNSLHWYVCRLLNQTLCSRHRLAACFNKQSRTGQLNHKKYHRRQQNSCPTLWVANQLSRGRISSHWGRSWEWFLALSLLAVVSLENQL